ncbi:unnamed protein product [marine sediment metagenome]|uniref:Uncharacterized protein n=1 Tax=marine sediment metagenome TaxID=412755 RepID=X0UCD8_9ZZZZ
MPKIDFNISFKYLDGVDVPAGDDEIEKDKDGKEIKKKKSPPFTLKTACVNVLLSEQLGLCVCPHCRAEVKVPEKLSGEEKCRRFMLATKIFDGKNSVDIGTKDIELLKDMIAKNYPPLTVGQAWAILDPDSAEEK